MRIAAKKREIILSREIVDELLKRGVNPTDMKAVVKKIDGKEYLVIESGGRSIRVLLEERDGKLVGVRVEE